MQRFRVLAVLACVTAGIAGCAQDRVVLLPGEDGSATGAVAVLSVSGETKAVLDKPYIDALVGSDGARLSTTDAAAVQAEHGALLASLPPPPQSFILYFREGTTVLRRKSRPELAKLFAEVKSRPGADVQVVGHTSTLGTTPYNDRLSRSRAREIADLLIERGLDPSLVRAVGRGERELLVKTADGVRNEMNRRVEVVVR